MSYADLPEDNPLTDEGLLEIKTESAGDVREESGKIGAKETKIQSPSEALCQNPLGLKSFFDVNTDDVLERLKRSAYPFHRSMSFLRYIEDKPDLYGPFWIAVTLVFLIGFCSNFSQWLQHSSNAAAWYSTYSIISVAVTAVAFYSLVVPSLFYGYGLCIGMPNTVSTLICLFGYSLIAYLPSIILCSLNYWLISWACLALSGFVAVFFLYNELQPLFEHFAPHQIFLMFLTVIIVNFGFCCFLKLYFFS